MSAITDTSNAVRLTQNLDDLPSGSLRMVRAGDRRLTLVRTSTGVYALDHACPHEGYGLTQGKLDGELLTCAWHNWKFRVTDGECVLGEEAVRTHRVEVGDDGSLTVFLNEPDPAEERRRLTQSLGRGIENNYVGQIARDVVRLLQVDANPGELVWQAVAWGAPRAEFGWGHSVAAAVDCLAMVPLFDGDERALPVVQAISAITEIEHRYPVQPLPDPASDLGSSPGTVLRSMIEAEDVAAAQSQVLGLLATGSDAPDMHRWLLGAVSDHHLSYGHGSIYLQKAFQLLDLLGWSRASTVLPYLVPTLIYGTREDTLPYMRPFVKALAEVDLGTLAGIDPEPAWRDDGRLLSALLGQDRRAPLAEAVRALRDGAGVNGLLDVVSTTVSERLLRYDPANERDPRDDFGWLDITHGLTASNAARWHAERAPGPDALRQALWSVFLAYWTGRHEWHTHVGERMEGTAWGNDLVAAGWALQQEALRDHAGATIVHVHDVKMAVAASEEALRLGSDLPLRAAHRYITGPRQERFVWGNVMRSIDFVAGRSPRDEDER